MKKANIIIPFFIILFIVSIIVAIISVVFSVWGDTWFWLKIFATSIFAAFISSKVLG
jgi:hypothetical protein